MKNKFDIYEQEYEHSDKLNIAVGLIEDIKDTDILVEKDPNTLKEMIDMDLRENVPPQIFELISCVIEMIDKVEKE